MSLMSRSSFDDVYLESVPDKEPAPVGVGAEVLRVYGNMTHLQNGFTSSGLQQCT